MGKVRIGYAMTTAIIGILCLLCGIGTSIGAWVLDGKRSLSQYDSNVPKLHTYWWGGIVYIVPGIFAIVAGCTRSIAAMVLYLVFNLLCMFASIAVSIMLAIVYIAWNAFNTMLQNELCRTFADYCVCADLHTVYRLGVTCDVAKTIQTLLAAIIAMAGISSVLSFVASYVSCCALCNPKNDSPTVFIEEPFGTFQSPNYIMTTSNNTVVAGANAYSQPQMIRTNDKAKLVKNEVI